MADDRTIKGPGAGEKAKPLGAKAKRDALRTKIQAAVAAPAIALEQSVQQAAEALELNHARIIRGLLEIAEHPYMRGSEKVAAWAQLADILGTKKQAPTNHLHLHGALAAVSDDRLEDRIARIVSGASA